MLKRGDSVGIVCCSNAQSLSERLENVKLEAVLKGMGLVPKMSPYIYQRKAYFSGTGHERAKALMSFYEDDEVAAIFDISGGDIANEVLELLDYDTIRRNPKPLFGYSDLTAVLNAIYKRTGAPSWLYQVKNLVLEDEDRQMRAFRQTFFEGEEDLYRFGAHFLQGSRMEGVVIGGNIRCFLKLAGTPYMPDFKDKILFLESMGGIGAKTCSALYQLRQMGAFRQASGVLLGTFTQMERKGEQPSAGELARMAIGDEKVPLAQTSQIGHGPDSRCLVIGGRITL